jgi:hypothetical protein
MDQIEKDNNFLNEMIYAITNGDMSSIKTLLQNLKDINKAKEDLLKSTIEEHEVYDATENLHLR